MNNSDTKELWEAVRALRRDVFHVKKSIRRLEQSKARFHSQFSSVFSNPYINDRDKLFRLQHLLIEYARVPTRNGY